MLYSHKLTIGNKDQFMIKEATSLEKNRKIYSHKLTIGNKDQFMIKEATSGIYSFLSNSLKGNNQNKLITTWLMNEKQQNGYEDMNISSNTSFRSWHHYRR